MPSTVERRSAGVANPGLDRVVERSAKIGPDLYLIPQAGAVHRDLVRAIGQVLAPLEEVRRNIEAAGFEHISVEFTHRVADGMHGAIVKAVKTELEQKG